MLSAQLFQFAELCTLAAGEEEPLEDELHSGHWRMASDLLPGIAMPPPGKGVSKYRGVSWHKRNRKWRATCRDRTVSMSSSPHPAPCAP